MTDINTAELPIEHIRSLITMLSGSGKALSTQRRHGIYSSMTLPGLDDMEAVRDTRRRFSDFGVPENLTGKTVIDVGSNVGAMIFEAARRGATVTGVEYRDDRVSLCRMIAAKFGFQADFHQCDLNALLDEGAQVGARPWLREQGYDVVICSSVDEYIRDLDAFYALLYGLCDGVIYFETNVQSRRTGPQQEAITVSMLNIAGFKNVEYLGNGHSGGISRKRKLFRAEV